jgi:DNA-directed RNA polymerase specialized sigma24 family protein
MPLPEWAREQARMAVEEGMVEALRSGASGAARTYCRRRLADGVAHHHAIYFLDPSVALRERHVRDAERILNERLAEYDGSVPFRHFIRQVAHRAGVERRGMRDLNDWLDSHARLAVERYVVERLRTDRGSHLALVNLQWVVQRVCQWYKAAPGAIADPRAGLDVIWARLLASVPTHLHERIKDHSATINMKILRGLPGFQFQSSIESWRMTIVKNTMASISKMEKKREGELPLYKRGDDADGPEQPLPIADGRQELDPHGARADASAIVKEVLRDVFNNSATVRNIVGWRVQGYEATEIEQWCGVKAAAVHRIYSRFRQECRRRYQDRGGAA